MIDQQKLGFVFTNYNNSAFTEDAIKSIEKFNDQLFPIIVVDNFSEPEDVNDLKRIENQYSNVKIIFSDENVGYFRGLNIGIDFLKVYYPEVKLMVIGNNDVLFPIDFYQSILNNNALVKKYSVISPNIITADGVHQNPHVIEKISKIREFVYDIYHLNYFFAKCIIKLAKITHSFTDRDDEASNDIAQEIYQGYGACYILTPKFFEYFLSKQLSDKGCKIFYEPSIKLTHLMHATTDKLPGKLKWKFSRAAHKEYRKYVKVI